MFFPYPNTFVMLCRFIFNLEFLNKQYSTHLGTMHCGPFAVRSDLNEFVHLFPFIHSALCPSFFFSAIIIFIAKTANFHFPGNSLVSKSVKMICDLFVSPFCSYYHQIVYVCKFSIQNNSIFICTFFLLAVFFPFRPSFFISFSLIVIFKSLKSNKHVTTFYNQFHRNKLEY